MQEPQGQVSFAWGTDGGTAPQDPVHASPPQSTPVDRKPRRTLTRPHAEGAELDPRWLTADETAGYLGLPTRKALYAAVERGQVPAHKLGRRLRFRREELDALLGRAR